MMMHNQNDDSKTVSFEAPDDVFVNDVIVKYGHVNKGDSLVALHSPSLERQLARLSMHYEHLSIAERPFNDGRLDEEMAVLRAKAQNLQDAKTSTDQILAETENEYRAGTRAASDWNNARVAAYSATSAYLDAKMAADQAPKKRLDMIDKIRATRNTMDIHKSSLQAFAAGMTIVAPEGGTFRLVAALGSFVQKGDIICELRHE
jgi:hypothetical protein